MMIMFWADNRQFCGFGVMSQLQGYSSFSTSTGTEACIGGGSVLVINNTSTQLMADDDELRNEKSRTEESSLKDIIIDQRDEEWLQLSIGGHPQDLVNDHRKKSNSNLVELELMPSSGSIHSTNSQKLIMPEFGTPPRPPVTISSAGTFTPFLLHQDPAATSTTNLFPPRHHQEINWPLITSTVAPRPSSSNSSSASYFQAIYGGVDNNMVDLDFRVIQPHSGIWFMLQASQNQEKEPFLPQISKSYLRIKDGTMTIRLVMKYLANKLRLENESEIEIRCKGQRLLPFLTLQHVRDHIWSNPRDFITLLPNSSTIHHIMVLNYARTASN